MWLVMMFIVILRYISFPFYFLDEPSRIRNMNTLLIYMYFESHDLTKSPMKVHLVHFKDIQYSISHYFLSFKGLPVIFAMASHIWIWMNYHTERHSIYQNDECWYKGHSDLADWEPNWYRIGLCLSVTRNIVLPSAFFRHTTWNTHNWQSKRLKRNVHLRIHYYSNLSQRVRNRRVTRLESSH